MNGKKWKILLQIAMIGCMMGSVIGLSGCSARGHALTYKEIEAALLALENYQAQVRITFYSNQGENVYELLQYADAQGRYRMEIQNPEIYQGVTTICDGESVVQMDPEIGASVEAKETPVRDNLILFGFLDIYRSDSTHQYEGPQTEGMNIVKLAAVQPESQIIRQLELTLDADSMIPQTLDLKDAQGQLLIRIEYLTFEGNTEIPESLFKTK